MRASCPAGSARSNAARDASNSLAAEQRQAIVKRLLIDAVGADGGSQAAGDFREGLRLPDVQPDDE